jgi:ribosomal protein L3 glutamine methyltransferase
LRRCPRFIARAPAARAGVGSANIRTRNADHTAMPADTDALTTIDDLVRWGASRFAAAALHFGHGTDNARDEAHWLVAHALHLPFELAAEYGGCHVTPTERELVLALLARRIDERRPAAYLTGSARFAGLDFDVDEGVMIPRSPLAELIEQGFAPWAEPERVYRVLDLCCGSGCLGIAAAIYLPDARVDLADISPEALAVARRNCRRHGLTDRVRVLASDLFGGIDADGDNRYDVIVSNPPYVGAAELETLPAEYRHEPVLALAGGELGLDLVLRILRDAPDYLADDGIVVAEVGNSAAPLAAAVPDVPFIWLEFERGGEGVLMLDRAALAAHHDRFAKAVAAT